MTGKKFYDIGPRCLRCSQACRPLVQPDPLLRSRSCQILWVSSPRGLYYKTFYCDLNCSFIAQAPLQLNMGSCINLQESQPYRVGSHPDTCLENLTVGAGGCYYNYAPVDFLNFLFQPTINGICKHLQVSRPCKAGRHPDTCREN